MASNLKWPEDNWVLLLQSSLVGKAREVYSALSVEESAQYSVVKSAILKAYELVPEAYRQRFRNAEKQPNQTDVEFARQKETFFDRWCMSKEIGGSYDKLRQLLLIEEFKNCLPGEVRTYLDERKAETLNQAAVLADDYILTHKSLFSQSSSQLHPKANADIPGSNPHKGIPHSVAVASQDPSCQDQNTTTVKREGTSWQNAGI